MDLFNKVQNFEPMKVHNFEPNIRLIRLFRLMLNYAKPRFFFPKHRLHYITSINILQLGLARWYPNAGNLGSIPGIVCETVRVEYSPGDSFI